MNHTLFDCGIKWKVEAGNGELFDIIATLPKTVGLFSKLVKCQTFAGQKYLKQSREVQTCRQEFASSKAK